MSNPDSTEVQSSESETPKRDAAPDSDWFLQQLVSFSNEWGIQMGITLQVGGLLVSGTLVNGQQFFDEFSSTFAAGFRTDSELGGSFKELIGSYKQIYTSEKPKDIDAPPPGYIHLKDARFFTPGQQPIPSQAGTLWRGRISEVGGFFLGSLN